VLRKENLKEWVEDYSETDVRIIAATNKDLQSLSLKTFPGRFVLQIERNTD
jgi:DNA-binding NtrC family response regulator